MKMKYVLLAMALCLLAFSVIVHDWGVAAVSLLCVAGGWSYDG